MLWAAPLPRLHRNEWLTGHWIVRRNSQRLSAAGRQVFPEFPQNLPRFRPAGQVFNFRIFSDWQSLLGTQGLQHQEHFCVFMLGKKIDLKIQMISLIRLAARPALAHEDEQREENGFQ